MLNLLKLLVQTIQYLFAFLYGLIHILTHTHKSMLLTTLRTSNMCTLMHVCTSRIDQDGLLTNKSDHRSLLSQQAYRHVMMYVWPTTTRVRTTTTSTQNK